MSDAEVTETTETTEVQETTIETKAEETTDWRDAIDDDNLRKFADRMVSPKDAVKMAYDLRQKLSTAVSVPGEGASEEEVAEYRKKMGVPESADKYEVKLSEELSEAVRNMATPESLKPYQDVALGLGMTSDQFNGLVNAFYKDVESQMAAQSKVITDARENAQASLRKELGAEYDGGVELAKRAVKEFYGDQAESLLQLELKDGTLLGDHPAFIRGNMIVGKRIGEGGIHIGMGDGAAADGIKDQIKTLQKQKWDAYDNGDTKTAQELSNKIQDLNRQLDGQEAIVGTMGRVA